MKQTPHVAVARLAIFAAIIATAVVTASRLGLLSDPSQARTTLLAMRQARSLPLWFVSVYAVTAALGVPPVIMTFVGGAIFGTAFGFLYSWIGGVLGAAGGYALARGLGGPAIRHLLGRHSARLDRLLDDIGFVSLFRLRINPIVPYNLLNFACGVTRVPFTPYSLAAMVGVIPATAVYAYFADSVIAGATRSRERALWHVAIASLVLIVLSYGPAIARRIARRR